MTNFLSLIRNSSGTEAEVLAILNQVISEPNWIKHTSKKEIQKISNFLCQIKHMRALKLLIIKCFEQPDKIPGEALMFYFSTQSKIDILVSVFKEIDDEYSIFKTYLCPYSLSKDLYKEHIAKQLEIYTNKYQKTKDDLIDKLQFARTQRLEGEVKKTLEKLIEAFPDDPSFLEEKDKYFEKEAAVVIEKSSKHYENKKNKKSNSHQHTPLFNAEEVYNSIKSEFASHQVEFLLEVFLIANEEEVAIKILTENDDLRKKHFWNYIDLLIRKRRYLEALAQIKDSHKIDSTDDEFNQYYYSSICLWSLNDKTTALETMKSIAKVKPNFKQTLFYLSLWLHHDEVA